MSVAEFISKAPTHIQPFVLFGPSHLMAIAVLFLLIYTATVAARQSDVFKKHYRLFLILALSIQEVVFKVWSGFYHPWQEDSLLLAFHSHVVRAKVGDELLAPPMSFFE